MSEADFLVSGATGRTGGIAIDELLKMGKRVRAYVRSDDERAAAQLIDAGKSGKERHKSRFGESGKLGDHLARCDIH